MNTRTLKTLLFALSGGLFLTVAPVHAEMRTWTSADGKTLQADFSGTAGAGANAVVKLKLADGSLIDYPIAKLSEADRLFVKGNLPTDPAALAAEIDKLVLNKLKESYYGLREELTALPQKADLTAAEKVKRKEEIEREMLMCVPNEMTNDNQFLRRIYLDVAGRIPTFDEAEAFLSDRAPNKRAVLIDKLLDSEGFVMRMYTYYADILRIREGITMMGNGDLKADPYIEYIKASIREDKPYDALVRELLTAKSGKSRPSDTLSPTRACVFATFPTPSPSSWAPRSPAPSATTTPSKKYTKWTSTRWRPSWARPRRRPAVEMP
jgi:hypothetical protein